MRHGHAGDRDAWTGDDRLRPLSERGQRQALWLVDQLRGRGVTRLVSSPYLRCTQSLDPLASALGMRVERAKGLVEGGEAGPCLELLARPGVVACTHGDIVEGVLADFTRRGIPIDGGNGTPKGGLWIVGTRRVTLIPPPR